jgi:hypothetical protein
MSDMPGWGSAVMQTYKDDLAAALARANRLEAKVARLEQELGEQFDQLSAKACNFEVELRNQQEIVTEQAATVERQREALGSHFLREILGWVEDTGSPKLWEYAQLFMEIRDAALNPKEPA